MTNKVMDYLNTRVIEMMDKGIVPWKKTWSSKGLKPMSITGHPYRGINLFLMSMLGHATPVYITYNQIKKMGGTIKDDAKQRHYPVYFYSIVDKEKGNPDSSKYMMFRYYQVWNMEDVEGIKLPKSIQAMIDHKATHEANPIESAELLVNSYQNAPQVKHDGAGRDAACYSPVNDMVHMPAAEQFDSMEEYYSTLFHEFGHSTGHSSRLNREELMKLSAFGCHDYSREELVAEMTAAMLSGECGITSDSMLDNNASYIASWASKIKAEPSLLLKAASAAQKAVDHILGIKWEAKTED